MLLRRQPVCRCWIYKSVLDLLRPDTEQRVCRNQERQKINHDQSSRLQTFKVGDPVLARNFGKDQAKWFRGCVSQCRGPLSYEITLEDGCQVRRCVDHLQPCAYSEQSSNDILDDVSAPDIASPNTAPDSPPQDSPAPASTPAVPADPPPTSQVQVSPQLCCSQRNRRPPDWVAPFIGGGKV